MGIIADIERRSGLSDIAAPVDFIAMNVDYPVHFVFFENENQPDLSRSNPKSLTKRSPNLSIPGGNHKTAQSTPLSQRSCIAAASRDLIASSFSVGVAQSVLSSQR